METILKITNLNKKFGHQYALKNINLTVRKGDIYGMIGRNEAGKTTIIKLVSRLISPTSGEVILFGSKNDKEWSDSLSRIGAVIETPVAYDNLTARQNLTYYCKLRGIVDAQKVITETLELVGLTNTGNKKFKQFSLGMKQKLGIAIAILSRPDLLILDEPINGLDPIAIADFRKLMLRLNKEKNMTIIISSHILTELYQIATRFAIINEGQLVKEISKEEFDELSEEYIMLKSLDVSTASHVLQENLHLPFKVVANNQINIFTGAHQIASITQSMVAEGVNVDEIVYQRQDLETYFTELVDASTSIKEVQNNA